jgi:hypothetical protein
MLQVTKPLGDLITTRPVSGDQQGRTAGPSFELFYETGAGLPTHSQFRSAFSGFSKL